MTPARLLGRGFAVLLTALLVLLGTWTPALAHDSVTGTSPADGSTVDTVPGKIQISMNNTPALIGSEVLILDQAGNDWAAGTVEVLDKVATQAVRAGAPAGSYTVKWRLVSSDSHPVEGEFKFTAAAASTSPAGAVVGAGPVASVQAEPEAAPTSVRDESAVPWSIIGLGVVLLGLVVALVVVARRRLSSED